MNAIRLDVWGGEDSCDHIARYHLSQSDALIRASEELRAGYLVNLRALAQGEGWGPSDDFDERCKLISGRA